MALRLYHGPRVIFPDGLTDGYMLRAVYTDVPFAFTSSIGAIGGEDADADLLKLLAVYLRSPLASYLLVMTGYSVIGERPRIALDDVEAFPFCEPKVHPEPKIAAGIVQKVARIFDRVAKTAEWQRGHDYARVKDELDSLIYDYFRLTANERILVQDTVRFVAPSIQPPDYQQLSTPLLHRPTSPEIEVYVNTLATELGEWRAQDKGKGSLSVRAYINGTSGFFGAVQITTERRPRDSVELVTSEPAYERLFSDLRASLTAQSAAINHDDLFKIPNIMVLAGDTFLLVKPLRRRFWLARTALTDADLIVKTVHAAAWGKSYS